MLDIVRCSDFSRDTLLEISYKVSDLIIISSQELFEVLFGDDMKNVVRDLFLAKGNLYSYENTWVAIERDQIVGVMVLFTQKDFFVKGLRMGLKILSCMGPRTFLKIPLLLKSSSLLLPIPKGSIYLSNISVLPEYRRRGLGREMLKYVSNYAKLLKCNKVVLDVGVENDVALRLYESEGFKVVAQTKSVKINTHTFCFYRMEKEIGI
ncbi:MAG: GNAT family N-acetyltransferase [Spirochaetia bacterium]|nr:GNAT family N-acetyltransferase [Spirochaetota bacterium]MCX8096742.1 GNAT family N-acetyltransferase [Spirochaetota bacterium]MDW8112151.1 GNAT family N-acetyltransferase [Spirochaetia bacterium]